MSTEALQVAEAFYGAIAARDPAAIDATLAHHSLVVVEPDGLPYGGTYMGIEGFHELSTKVAASWKRARLLDVQLASAGNRVFGHFIFSAIARGTGQEVAVPIVEVLEVSDGKIVSIRPFYWDTYAVREVLGLAG
jgi:ketosteroid isomerase-like protein